MVNKTDATLSGLRALNLSMPEAKIYLYLLQKPCSHAQLSLATGINRTTLYRLVNSLEKRGIVAHRLDDTGKYLVAADPATLEVEVVTQEEKAKRQRAAFGQLLPALETIKSGYAADFAIHTYEGTEGFKRMLWHELKTAGNCLCIGFGTLEDLTLDHRWSEKCRQMTVDAGYRVLEITHPGAVEDNFTKNQTFLDKHYAQRTVSKDILPIYHLITTYNDTVGIYNVHKGQRIGLEIVSKTYAQTARKVFAQFWQLASPN